MTEQPPRRTYPPPPSGAHLPPGGGYRLPPPPRGYPLLPPRGYPPRPVAALSTEDYTSWIQRVGALIIDTIPVLLIYGIGFGIAFGISRITCETNSYGYRVGCSSSGEAVEIAVLVIAWLLALAYTIWNWGYRQGTTGSSLGKSLLKFKVVSERTGQPIGFGTSIVRQITHVVDGIFCYIGYLFPLWDAKRQTLADKIMNTVCL